MIDFVKNCDLAPYKTCILVLLVVHAAFLQQLYSPMSFSTKMDAIFHQPHSLPIVDPPPHPPPDHYPRLHHDETAPYRILLWVWVVIRGLAGRCFTVGDRCPTPLPPPHPTQCQHRRTQIQQLWQQTKTICIQQYPTGSRYNEINKSETQRFRGETLVRPKTDTIRSDKRLKIKSNQTKKG